MRRRRAILGGMGLVALVGGACSSFGSATDAMPSADAGGEADPTVEAAAPDASFCARQEAGHTFCADFDEQATVGTPSWIAGPQQHFVEAGILVVPAAFASLPQALRVELVSPPAQAPGGAAYYLRHIDPGVVKKLTVEVTVVVDTLVAFADAGIVAGTSAVDGRLFAAGDSSHRVEVNVTTDAKGALAFSLLESTPSSFVPHDYTFSRPFLVGEPHRVHLDIDYAARTLAISVDGFDATPAGTMRSFIVPFQGNDAFVDLGTKTDRTNMRIIERYDDLVFDLVR